MLGELTFSEETMIDGNLFAYEQRLNTQVNRYTENGMLLTTYFSLNEEHTTVDRGTQDVEMLFGKRSPIRYDKILNFPLHGFNSLNTDNDENNGIEDFETSGECIIIPGLIVPKQYDLFIINHLKMKALFMVTGVAYDSMKVNGNYKISYRLYSTSEEDLKNVEYQVIGMPFRTDLNAIGTSVNPIIREDDFILKSQITKMIDRMINSYYAMFYNSRHNCFLFRDRESGLVYFDTCGNEFMAKHSLMNPRNSAKVVALYDKLRDPDMAFYYNNSIYNWLESGAPERMLWKFQYKLNFAEGYPESSFARWNESDIQVIIPLSIQQTGLNSRYSYFDEDQFQAFLNKDQEADANEYDKLIWKFINKKDNLRLQDVSLTIGDALMSSVNHWDIFIYTPMIIYIIREILSLN